jgi:uncharacterized membrane protein YfcA
MEIFLHFALPLLLGSLLGFTGGIFGIGGGIIAVPVLSALFGMDQKLAQGTALMMMMPNLSIALWRYHQRQPLPPLRAALLALIAMAASAATAGYATGLDSSLLRHCFGGFLLWLALLGLWRLATPGPGWHLAWPERFLPLVGVLGGACSGLLGIGGGLVATPIFVTCFRQRQAMAQGLALALVTPSSGVALANFAKAGLVDWKMGALLTAGGLWTVSRGVRLAHRLPEQKLRLAYALMLASTALWMLIR